MSFSKYFVLFLVCFSFIWPGSCLRAEEGAEGWLGWVAKRTFDAAKFVGKGWVVATAGGFNSVGAVKPVNSAVIGAVKPVNSAVSSYKNSASRIMYGHYKDCQKEKNRLFYEEDRQRRRAQYKNMKLKDAREQNTDLKSKVAALERDKKELDGRVSKMNEQVKVLTKKNRRCERRVVGGKRVKAAKKRNEKPTTGPLLDVLEGMKG